MRLRIAELSVFSAWTRMERFIMVFLPIKITESPLKPALIPWSWLDPTLSTPTTSIWLYVSNSLHSFSSYAIFFSVLAPLPTAIILTRFLETLCVWVCECESNNRWVCCARWEWKHASKPLMEIQVLMLLVFMHLLSW